MRPTVIGRLFWDEAKKYPSPWITFNSRRDFKDWSYAVKQAYPGMQTEWHYCNSFSAPDLLQRVRERAEKKGLNIRSVKIAKTLNKKPWRASVYFTDRTFVKRRYFNSRPKATAWVERYLKTGKDE